METSAKPTLFVAAVCDRRSFRGNTMLPAFAGAATVVLERSRMGTGALCQSGQAALASTLLRDDTAFFK